MDIEENVELTEDEQIIYFQALAAIANANDNVNAEELNFFRGQKGEFDVSDRVRKAAKKALIDPPDINTICQSMAKSDVKYTLYLDCIMMAYADDILCVDEENALARLADHLDIADEQARALMDFAEAAIEAEKAEGEAREAKKKVVESAASNLAAAGVPIAAVAVSGKVAGLSAAGITSGLAALGFGFGMATGVGVVAALGVGSYVGVKKLFG